MVIDRRKPLLGIYQYTRKLEIVFLVSKYEIAAMFIDKIILEIEQIRLMKPMRSLNRVTVLV